MKKLYSSLLIALSMSFSASVLAFVVTCPQSVEVEAERLSLVPQKWETFQAQSVSHHLDGVTFYSGHPKEQASLAPDHSKKFRAHWKFSSQDKIFIACSYQKTALELIQELPAVKRCEVVYDEHQQGWVPKKVECK